MFGRKIGYRERQYVIEVWPNGNWKVYPYPGDDFWTLGLASGEIKNDPVAARNAARKWIEDYERDLFAEWVNRHGRTTLVWP